MPAPKDTRQAFLLVVGSIALWVVVALWFLPWRVLAGMGAAAILLLLLAGLLRMMNNRRYERLANRKCINCGYDLRQSKDRCPECGAVFGLGWGGFIEE